MIRVFLELKGDFLLALESFVNTILGNMKTVQRVNLVLRNIDHKVFEGMKVKEGTFDSVTEFVFEVIKVILVFLDVGAFLVVEFYFCDLCGLG